MKKGDTVRIKNYSEALNGELGTIDYIDGGYIGVFPDCQPDNTKYPVELYFHEVEIVDTLD